MPRAGVGLALWAANRLGTAFAFKQCLGMGLYFSLPLAHLHGMNPELLGYLVDCLHPAYRLEAHLGFEFRQVCVALLRFTHGLFYFHINRAII